jgi:hypothetical protein
MGLKSKYNSKKETGKLIEKTTLPRIANLLTSPVACTTAQNGFRIESIKTKITTKTVKISVSSGKSTSQRFRINFILIINGIAKKRIRK